MTCRLLTLLLLALFVAMPLRAEVSRNAYHTILDVIEKSYQQTFRARGERLKIDRLWSDDTEQASAWWEEDRWGEIAILRIPGGLPRLPIINADAFTLVVCHEIGHHLAGPPQVWKYSVEGQADYFGVSDCLRRVFPKLPEFAAVREETTPAIVRQRCRSVYPQREAYQLCIRSALAGARLTRYFAHKRHIGYPLFEQPEPSVPENTLSGPPSPQCRLDTYFAAALCSPGDAQQTQADGRHWLCRGSPPHNPAGRPACWLGADAKPTP